VVGKHPEVADNLRRRIREEGPLRSIDMEGGGSRGWWDLKVAKKVASALWSSGELAIRERAAFQRTYDLAERVIPDRWRGDGVPEPEAIERLLLRALAGHGWAATGTLAQTFRLSSRQASEGIERLSDRAQIVACSVVSEDGGRHRGWIRPQDLELAGRLERVRPREDRGVLLSPFDPLLWDRRRVHTLFGFHQVLEIFKPAEKRIYGYYCLPVLAGEHLVARADLKTDRKSGHLEVLSLRLEDDENPRHREAARTALDRFAEALSLRLA
jgi:hypothetical protein